MTKEGLIKLFKKCCNNSDYDNYRERTIKYQLQKNVFQFLIGASKLRIINATKATIVYLPENAKQPKIFIITHAEYLELETLFKTFNKKHAVNQ